MHIKCRQQQPYANIVRHLVSVCDSVISKPLSDGSKASALQLVVLQHENAQPCKNIAAN
jgi:hypothetical protein